MCWISSNDPDPSPAHEASKKKKEEKKRKYCISERCRARNAAPMVGWGWSSRYQSAADGTQGQSQPLCRLSLLGMPKEEPHGACKTSVEMQMKGERSKRTNTSTSSWAGGRQPLPPPIPLCRTCCHPSRGLGCSKRMGTESGAVQSAGRNMWTCNRTGSSTHRPNLTKTPQSNSSN